MKIRYLNIVLLFLLSAMAINAKNLKEAKSLYIKGEYEKAKPLFEKELKRKPKDASINHWLGVCLYKTGKKDKAIKYLEFADTKDVLESSHYLAKICIEDYDFKGGLEYYERYKSLLDEKQLSEDDEQVYERAKIAKTMLEHVEKIVIIDSIQVDKKDFFKHFRISPESGVLCNPSSILPGIKTDNNVVAHCNQSEDRIIWTTVEDSCLKLCESTKLLDGKWDSPLILSGELNDCGNINYPYLMQDGLTLYFASDGNGSIGGYDIFMTRKDSESGEYMRPQNIGMPYNSSADDYMLVLDDFSGLGWWATNRNCEKDRVVIYVFIRNDVRENYDITETNLTSFAKITNYRATWGEQNYTSLATKLKMLETNAIHTNVDFIFSIKKGVIYTSFTDFKSEEASEQMSLLLNLYTNLDENYILLKEKRATYSLEKNNNNEDIKREILDLESQVELLRKDIFTLENRIRFIESSH